MRTIFTSLGYLKARITQKVSSCLGRHLGLLLIPLMSLFATNAMADESGSCGDNITWSYSADSSTLTIFGTGAMEDYESSDEQPWAGLSFSKLVLKGSNITVGSNAFRYINFSAIEGMENVVAVGDDAFYGCSGLESLDLSKVTTVGNRAFSSWGNLSTVIVNGGATLKNHAFAGSGDLSTVVFTNSDNQGTLLYKVFENCPINKIIVLGKNGINAGSSSLYISESYTLYYPAGAEDKFSAWSTASSRVKLNYHNALNATCSAVGYLADGYYSADTSLYISDNGEVKNVADYISNVDKSAHAWTDWKTVRSVSCVEQGVRVRICKNDSMHKDTSYISIPEATKSDFCGGNMRWYYYADLSTLLISGSGAMDNYENAAEQPWADLSFSKVVFSGSDITVGSYTFSEDEISTIEGIENVVAVKDHAFSNCEELTSLNLSSVSTIGNRAFSGCKNLTSVIVNGGAALDDYVFINSTSLSAVVFTSSDTQGSLSNNVFQKCPIRQLVMFVTSAPAVSDFTFSNINGSYTLYFPTGAEEVFSAWSSATNRVTLSYLKAKDATCSAGGYKANGFYSTDSSIYVSDESEVKDAADYILNIAENAHAWVWDTVKTATCTETGLIVGICKNDANHRDTVVIEVNKDAHAWGVWDTVKHETCLEQGMKIRVCVNDSMHRDTSYIPLVAAENGKCGDDLYWYAYTDSSTLVITGSGDMYANKDLPWSSNHEPWNKLSKLIVSGSHVKISDYAFNGYGFSILEGDVEEIGNSAFQGCGNLQMVDFPNVTIIGDSAFRRASYRRQIVTTFWDLSNAKYIGEGAFYEGPEIGTLYLTTAVNLKNCNISANVVRVFPSDNVGSWSPDAFYDVNEFMILDTVAPADSMNFHDCSRFYHLEGGPYGGISLDYHKACAATCVDEGYKADGYYGGDYYVNEKNEINPIDDYIIPVDWSAHDYSNKILGGFEGFSYCLWNYVCERCWSGSDFHVIKEYNEKDNLELKQKDGKYYVDTLFLDDERSFYSPVDFQVGTLIYNRRVESDTVSFILPFDIPVSSLNGEVYKLSSVASYDSLSFVQIFDTAKASTPYLLLAGCVGEMMLDTIYNAEVEHTRETWNPDSYNSCHSVICESPYWGRFTHLGDDDTTYCVSERTSYYIYYKLQGNKFSRVDSVAINPFRTVIGGLSSFASSYNIKLIDFPDTQVSESDSISTGVKYIESETILTGKVNVYDVLGRMVRSNVDAKSCFDGLRAGIYVVNGRKFIVRDEY